MDWQSILQTVIGSALGAGLGVKIFEKIWDEWRESKKKKLITKEELKDGVLKICAEASSSNFKNQPRDKEHTQFIIDSIYGIDYMLASELEVFVVKWCFYSEMEAISEKVKEVNKNFGNPNDHSADSLKENLNKSKREIVKMAHKIGSGHIKL